MHPFPQYSACVIDYLSVQAYLHFFPEVDALEALVTGHDHILSADLQPLTARLPTYPQLFHLNPQPRHFFLETKVFDNASLVIASLEGQQQHWLFTYRKFDLLVIGRDLDINELPLILLELVAITSAHVCFVVSVLGVWPMRVVVIYRCAWNCRLEIGRRMVLGLMIEVAVWRLLVVAVGDVRCLVSGLSGLSRCNTAHSNNNISYPHVLLSQKFNNTLP